MDISKRVFGSNVSKKIRNYINKLQEGTFDIQPGEEVSVNFDTQTYLGDRTPYSRMWTSITKSKVKWGPEQNKKGEEIAGGKKKWNPVGERENFVYSINENRNRTYEELEPMTIPGVQLNYKYKGELENNPYLKPSAGIKSVSSKSEGSLGALRRTTVEFVVHNKHDFEQIYLPYFLKPGANVFIDFGWSDKAFRLYNPEGKLHVDNDLQLKKFWEDIIQKPESSVEGGFQTTIAGNVVKYDVNVDQNGSFNCTLEVVSGNYRLLDKSVTDDNDLSFIFETSLEELLLGYYAKISGIDVSANDFVEVRTEKKISPEKKVELVRKVFDAGAKLTDANSRLMNQTAKLTGIFFQQYDSGKTLNDKESLYISFGFFEDKFLNNFVSEWVELDDDGKTIKGGKTKAENPFSPSFCTIHTYIRYDENLFTMMTKPYQKEEKLISFLYPDGWEIGSTYNKFKPNGWGKRTITVDEEEVTYNGTQVDKELRRIPLREVFISVPLISEAFKKSENVNDALEFIFNQIYEDSGNIINIKLISPNDSQAALTFTDVNVNATNESTDDTLRFDLTSGNTIVQSFDLKFETPKAGLASMIAIGNLKQPAVFDELELMKFNLLNSVSDGSKYQVQHLPVYSDVDSKKKALTLQIDKVLDTVDKKQSFESNDLLDPSNYEDYKKERGFKGKTKTKTIGSDSAGSTSGGTVEVSTTSETVTEGDAGFEGEFTGYDGKQEGEVTVVYPYGYDGQDSTLKQRTIEKTVHNRVEEKMPTETPAGETIFYAKNERDYYLLKAKIENFILSKSNSISPVMPITLSLKVYGNNFLNVGDFFTVNYLPKHYQELVYFQVVGVDHSIDTSGWSTNYTTVMRLKSKEKYKSLGDVNMDDELVTIKFHDIYKDTLIENLSDDNEGLSALSSDVIPAGSAVTRIDPALKAANNVKNEDMPDIEWIAKTIIVDPVGNSEKFEEKLKELGNEKVSKEKVALKLKIKDMNSWSRVKYWRDISDLILGDDLIDWGLVRKDNNDTAKLELRRWNKRTKLSTALENRVYITPRLDTKAKVRYGANRSKDWETYVLGEFDDIITEILEYRVSTLDSAQLKIDETIFQNLLNKASKSIGWPDVNEASRYASKTGEREVGNPYLLRAIYWSIPRETTSEWTEIEIIGTPETNILPRIVVPKKYMKINSAESLDKLNREWSRTYITGKENRAITGYTMKDELGKDVKVSGIFDKTHYR